MISRFFLIEEDEQGHDQQRAHERRPVRNDGHEIATVADHRNAPALDAQHRRQHDQHDEDVEDQREPLQVDQILRFDDAPDGVVIEDDGEEKTASGDDEIEDGQPDAVLKIGVLGHQQQQEKEEDSDG